MSIMQCEATDEIIKEAFYKGYFTNSNGNIIIARGLDKNTCHFNIGYDEEDEYKTITGLCIRERKNFDFAPYENAVKIFFDEILGEDISLEEALASYKNKGYTNN